MNNKNIILITVGLLIGLGIGIFVGNNIFAVSNQQVCNNQATDQNNPYKTKFLELQDRLKDSGAIQGLSDDREYKSISGIVKSIESNTIKIESKLLQSYLDPDLDERYIEVDENTRIIMVVKKSDKEIETELSRLDPNEVVRGPSSPSGGISLYKSEEVTIGQIEKGKLITVNSNINIRDEKNIKAIEIYFEK